jgi:hypothetical protein
MAKRAESMALIDSALLGESTQPAPTTDTSVIEPHAAPPLEDEKQEEPKMTAEQKAVYEAQKKLLGEQKAEELRLKQLADEQKSAALQLADTATKQARAFTDGANAKLGDVPTPGSIAFPLVLLGIFFFVLIQFNGFTRFQWLWMTITGNAYVTDQTVGAPAGGAVGGGPPNPAQEVVYTPALTSSFSKSGMTEAF